MDTVQNKVFIDPDKNSKYYDYLTDFSYNKAYFSETIKYLKDATKRSAKSNKLTTLPKKWIPLFVYKGNYYVYCPCDGIFDYKVLITDEFVCETDAMGMNASQFNSIKKIDDKTYVNPENNYNWNEHDLTIRIVDVQKGIAIFSSKRNSDNTLHHRLMVDASKIKLFPLIKNFCPGGKEMEFDFDRPEFEKLLHINTSH